MKKRFTEEQIIRVSGQAVFDPFYPEKDRFQPKTSFMHENAFHGLLPKTRQAIEYHIAKTNVAPITLAELSPAAVQTFAEHLERNLSTVVARKVYHTLCIGLKYCRKHQWLRHIPTEDIRIESRDREHSGKVGIPSKEQIRALLKAADEDITGFDGAFVRVLAFCGLRPSEMRGLPRPLVRLDTDPPTLEVVLQVECSKVDNPMMPKKASCFVYLKVSCFAYFRKPWGLLSDTTGNKDRLSAKSPFNIFYAHMVSLIIFPVLPNSLEAHEQRWKGGCNASKLFGSH